MFADNTLTPKEATRLCVLGTLAVDTGALRYGTLARTVRHFIDRILGPSLDLMAPSIELLKYEGLVEAVEGRGMEDDATFTLTDEGREALRQLLTAPIRTQATDLNKLIIALKFRFLHLLDAADQRAQVELIADYLDAELARLEDLREFHADDPGHLREWLDHDIAQVETRLGWLEEFRQGLAAGS